MASHINLSIGLLLLVFITGACDAAPSLSNEITIVERIVAGQRLYIPDVYLDFPYTSAGGQSALIQAYYPGSMPVPDDPQKLWEQGEWYKNVRILFTERGKPPSREFLDTRIEFSKTFKNDGVQYGLTALTQDNPDDASRDDIWIEDAELGFFINCTGKRHKDDDSQICTHYFSQNDYRFRVSYNKKILSDWKLIKSNVLALFDSFESRETATAYIQNLNIQDIFIGE